MQTIMVMFDSVNMVAVTCSPVGTIVAADSGVYQTVAVDEWRKKLRSWPFAAAYKDGKLRIRLKSSLEKSSQ